MATFRLASAFALLLGHVPAVVSLRMTLNANSTDVKARYGECQDKDGTNSQGWDCSFYYGAICIPKWDTEDFVHSDACCACGGGYYFEAFGTEDPCPATCHGYTCDEWVNNGAGNTCDLLESEYQCTCSGCACGAGATSHADDANQQYQDYPQEQNQEYPQTAYQEYSQGTYQEDAQGTHQEYPQESYHNVEAGDTYEDGTQQWDDPRNYYWSVGDGYCVDQEGKKGETSRLPGIIGTLCASTCNMQADCYGYAPDSAGCEMYHSKVYHGDGNSHGYGCFVKALTYEQQVDNDTKAKEQDGKGAAEKEVSTSQRVKVSYKPLGVVDAEMAQVFSFVDKSSAFFLKTKFEPPSFCVDTNEECRRWASDGYCTSSNHDVWMRENCKFSCAACKPKVDAPKDTAIAMFKKAAFSFHGTVEVTLQNRKYRLSRPNLINFATTWRVSLMDDTVLFSLQRSPCKRNDGCLAVWKIFKGLTRDDKVVYYGVQRTTSFKFYRSESDFNENPKGDWRAKLQKPVRTKQDIPSTSYQVTVMPAEDAGLLLLASYIIHEHGDLLPSNADSDVDSTGYMSENK